MITEEKIKGLEHLLRKCPDVITALQASRLIRVSKNSIHDRGKDQHADELTKPLVHKNNAHRKDVSRPFVFEGDKGPGKNNQETENRFQK